MLCIGIDPGLTGHIALWDDATDLLAAFPIPTYEMLIAGKTRQRVDTVALCNLTDALALFAPDICMIERVGGRPRQSAPAAFAFGFTCGAIEAACLRSGLRVSYATPSVWKPAMGLPSGGDTGETARALAGELFPAHRGLWPLKKHHDVAEAALLARYARDYVMAARKRVREAA